MTATESETGLRLGRLAPIKPSIRSEPAQRPKEPSRSPSLPSLSPVPLTAGRTLDFDIENRPLSYLGSDFTTSDITSIAWGWADEEDVYCVLLTPDPESQRDMLLQFVEVYNQADVVTGHYIRNHDLPIINGALFEWRLPSLKPKRTCDTKNDLRKFKGVSKSQESLADMLEIEEQKYHMSQRKWRAANRLRPEGIEEARTRCCNDIVQHKELRRRLLAEGWLKPAKIWAA